MTSARARDPYPYTWEIPALLALLTLTVLAAGVHLARALANLVTGHGFTWPTDHEQVILSLPAVVAGDASAGLPAGSTGADPVILWVTLGLVESLLLASLVTAGAHAYTRWGPGRPRGMATPAEAQQLLGLARLRRNRAMIRPDLYDKAAPR